LKKAVRTGDVTNIAVAQTQLKAARAKRAKERWTAKVANEMQKCVDKHKSILFDHFIRKLKTD